MDPQIKDKLEETEFFLGEMENSFQDDKKFKYMYSAFLSSGQSTLYYLVSRYKDTPGFYDWYWGKKVAKGIKAGGRIDNPEIKHLMNARGIIIHVENMPQGATRNLSIGANITIVDPRAPKEKVTIKPGTLEEDVSASSPKTVVRWLINEEYMRYENHGKVTDDTKHVPTLKSSYSAEPIGPNKIDIMKISKAELDEVKKVLVECETMFP